MAAFNDFEQKLHTLEVQKWDADQDGTQLGVKTTRAFTVNGWVVFKGEERLCLAACLLFRFATCCLTLGIATVSIADEGLRVSAQSCAE
eukprot:56042-Amphidinium_carterae.1